MRNIACLGYKLFRLSTRRHPFRQESNPFGKRQQLQWHEMVLAKDWIELFIRNEKILSPDSEISRNFHIFYNCSAILNEF